MWGRMICYYRLCELWALKPVRLTTQSLCDSCRTSYACYHASVRRRLYGFKIHPLAYELQYQAATNFKTRPMHVMSFSGNCRKQWAAAGSRTPLQPPRAAQSSTDRPEWGPLPPRPPASLPRQSPPPTPSSNTATTHEAQAIPATAR